MVAMVTPMKSGILPDTELDREALERLIEFHIESSTDAIVAVGTTGESATLTSEEHCEVIAQYVEIAHGRIPIIAGTGANSTIESICLTQNAKEAGADACLLVTPYYNKPTQEGLYQHHKMVAETVDIPQLLYNVPGRTACDMLPATIARLAEIPNIIGVKEATGELDRAGKIRELVGDKFILLSGDDATACNFLLLGGDGVISVTANAAPKQMHNMSLRAIEKNNEAAREINHQLEKLHDAMSVEVNPIPAKWALNRMGLIDDGIRLPLTWMSTEYEIELEQAMKAAGIL